MSLERVIAAAGRLVTHPRRELANRRERYNVRRFLGRVAERGAAFDATWGTETAVNVEAGELEFPPQALKHSSQYSGTDENVIRTLIEATGVPYEENAFVDVGSGKGKLVFISATYPFELAIGVEYSHSLHEVALANLGKLPPSIRRAKEVRAVCADATSFELPARPTVMTICNPFSGPLMDAFFANVCRSLTGHPREMWVLYVNPVRRDLFDGSALFGTALSAKRVCVYRHPADGTPIFAAALKERFDRWER